MLVETVRKSKRQQQSDPPTASEDVEVDPIPSTQTFTVISQPQSLHIEQGDSLVSEKLSASSDFYSNCDASKEQLRTPARGILKSRPVTPGGRW